MDYKEKYEDALNRAKIINPGTSDYEVAVKIFPELKESENEKIIVLLKNIIKYLDNEGLILPILCQDYDHEEYAKILAWLEKQGRKSADKVEPKFKVGDWIVYCNEDIDLITDVEETGYIINKGSGYIPFVSENDMNIWTIQDAKDGDVLVDEKPFIFRKIDSNKHTYAYCGISVDDGFRIVSEGEFGEWTWMQDIKPATKEQRDFLFQKMKEAGYEWDAEKKELKKIEQKPAWSEEEKQMLNKLIADYEFFVGMNLVKDDLNMISWLKSLKQRMKGE